MQTMARRKVFLGSFNGESAQQMHDFLDTFRAGPETLPPGEYAMWLPSPDEPMFAPSKTRQNIG